MGHLILKIIPCNLSRCFAFDILLSYVVDLPIPVWLEHSDQMGHVVRVRLKSRAATDLCSSTGQGRKQGWNSACALLTKYCAWLAWG